MNKSIQIRFRILACVLSLMAVVVLVICESSRHFDNKLIQDKKKAHSAQNDWNVFFAQSNVYLGGGVRHDEDFARLAPLLEADSSLITDIATSYYAAASLPVYVKNVHKHHGRYKSPEWERLISHRITCYLDAPEYIADFNSVMQGEESRSERKGVPPVRYIAVNRTHYNDNFKRGCMSQRRRGLLSVIDRLGPPIFEGETILVHRLSSTAP